MKKRKSMSRTSRNHFRNQEIASVPPAPTSGQVRSWKSRRTEIGIMLFLALISLAVFGQTMRFEFVNVDDDSHVYNNPIVSGGLSTKGIAYAFTHSHGGHWIPLNTISHMLDCQFYGLSAGGHHLTNVLLHTVSAILLFWVLRQMTSAVWSSAFVAAFFAVHPLRVESVAWVAERKDVLSGVFFMLTLWAYVRYTRQPSPARYAGVAAMFACGLMSKFMVATLPLVLLLLDYWPLHRFSPACPSGQRKAGPARLASLIREKIPLLILVVAAGLAMVFAQKEDGPRHAAAFNGTMRSLAVTFGERDVEKEDAPAADLLAEPMRTGDALLTPVVYLWQMVYPVGLTIQTHSFKTDDRPLREVILALIAMVIITGGVFALRRSHPYLLVGWFWYLIMLAPVLALIRTRLEVRCDRYTYLPQIGIYVLLTWGAAHLSGRWRWGRSVILGSGGGMLVACIAIAHLQTSFWRGSESLWTRALAWTANNYKAHNNLGGYLFKNGRVEEAIAHWRQAADLSPEYSPPAANLGMAFLKTGRIDEAIISYRRALEIDSANQDTAYNLGMAFFRDGQVDEAITCWQKAIAIKSDYIEAHNNLGSALLQMGRVNEAAVHFQNALDINPRHRSAQTNLAWVLATASDASIRNGTRAVELAEQANRVSADRDAMSLRTLAAAYAEVERFPEAIEAAERALDLANAERNALLAAALHEQLWLYRAGLPYHTD